MATGQANAETATDHCVNLTCNEAPIVCYENHAQDSRVKPCGECSPQINAKAGTGGGNLLGKDAKDGDRQTTGIGNDGDPSPTIGTSHHHAVAMRHSVRRLLPVECERLMGFPDNHTRIPWRGKPEEQCPDSPRYRACGNSMCVNVMRWIGMQIEYVERKMNRKAGEE